MGKASSRNEKNTVGTVVSKLQLGFISLSNKYSVPLDKFTLKISRNYFSKSKNVMSKYKANSSGFT
jgi:hypothetical protein